jgi:hypothetical protein
MSGGVAKTPHVVSYNECENSTKASIKAATKVQSKTPHVVSYD